MVAFAPRGMTAEQVKQRCIEARQQFYGINSIFKRGLDFKVNSRNWFMWSHFFSINLLFRAEVLQRKDFPLGDESYTAPLIKADHGAHGRVLRAVGRRRHPRADAAAGHTGARQPRVRARS